MTDDKDYSIFNGDRFIDSMRSSGYRDTSYAVAELVDNAIDAGAKHVEIICRETRNPNGRYYLDKIAVLDNGHGMNSQELRSSLLFGDGTRGGNPKDIGKYGMGLPNSSLSQCKRVEVYSWQNSAKPMYSYLDVDEVKKGRREIPIPESAKIPDEWEKVTKKFPKKSGTLIIWSKLDRCTWVTSKKIMEHSQFLIGRIYRRFLSKKTTTIDMTVFRLDDGGEIIEHNSDSMLPNDPMYLMAPSSTPSKWGEKPMFKPDTVPEKEYEIDYEGQKHKIMVRYSIEKDELRAVENVEGDQGNTLHGRHARRNTGISIMRADREITLDTNLVASSDPRERWWGAEMDIPISLDLVVGLTNNKQQVDVLSTMMYSINQLSNIDREQNDIKTELSEQETTQQQIFRMILEISSHIRSMQKRIRATRAGTRTGKTESRLDEKIESGIRQEQKEGKKNRSDEDRKNIKKEQRIEIIAEELIEDGIEKDVAMERATNLVEEDKKVIFSAEELDGSNFFNVKNIGGILRIKINSNHRAYKNLFLLTESEKYEDLDINQRFELTREGLWLLLVSWARFEDLISLDEKRKAIQDIRFEWGKELDIFLEQNGA